jgi:hypothetical protein
MTELLLSSGALAGQGNWASLGRRLAAHADRLATAASVIERFWRRPRDQQGDRSICCGSRPIRPADGRQHLCLAAIGVVGDGLQLSRHLIDKTGRSIVQLRSRVQMLRHDVFEHHAPQSLMGRRRHRWAAMFLPTKAEAVFAAAMELPTNLHMTRGIC